MGFRCKRHTPLMTTLLFITLNAIIHSRLILFNPEGAGRVSHPESIEPPSLTKRHLRRIRSRGFSVQAFHSRVHWNLVLVRRFAFSHPKSKALNQKSP